LATRPYREPGLDPFFSNFVVSVLVKHCALDGPVIGEEEKIVSPIVLKEYRLDFVSTDLIPSERSKQIPSIASGGRSLRAGNGIDFTLPTEGSLCFIEYFEFERLPLGFQHSEMELGW